jgi:hypothetical protein
VTTNDRSRCEFTVGSYLGIVTNMTGLHQPTSFTNPSRLMQSGIDSAKSRDTRCGVNFGEVHLLPRLEISMLGGSSDQGLMIDHTALKLTELCVSTTATRAPQQGQASSLIPSRA